MSVQTISPEIQRAIDAFGASLGVKLAPVSETPSASDNRCMSTAEAALYCGGISYWTLRRAHERGELPILKLGNGKNAKILFERNALDKWLTSKRNRGGDKTARFSTREAANG